MRRADLAEAILALATTPERAAAMAGDFLEDDSSGAPQFWFVVARTAVAQVWRQMSPAPFASAGIAIRVALAEMGILAAAFFADFLLMWIAVSVMMVSFHSQLPDVAMAVPAWLLSNIAVPVQVGRWMARRYPGREAAATITLAAFHALVNLCMGAVCWEVARFGGEAHADISLSEIRFIDWNGDIHHTLRTAVFYATLYPLLVLAGAAWSRTACLMKVR